MRITGILKKLCEFLWEPLNGKNFSALIWISIKKNNCFCSLYQFLQAKGNVRMIQWRRFVFFFFYQFQLYFFDKNCPKIMEMVVLIRITIECTYIMECMYHILWSINHAIIYFDAIQFCYIFHKLFKFNLQVTKFQWLRIWVQLW